MGRFTIRHLAIASLVLAIIASDFKSRALAEKNSRIVTYQGLPGDNITTTTKRMTKFIIKSDLKGSVKFVVNKWLGINEMRVKVKLNGWTETNLSVFHVNYTKSGRNRDTVLLHVYEPLEFESAVKLNKNSLTFIIATGSACLGIILLSVLASAGVYFYKKYKKEKPTRRYYELYEVDSFHVNDSIDSSSETGSSGCSSDATSTSDSSLSKEKSSSGKEDCETEQQEDHDEDNEEEDDDSEEDDASNEEDDTSKEEDDHSKEDDSSKDEDDDSREDDTSKEEDDDSREDDSSTEEYDDSREDDASKEEDDDSREDGTAKTEDGAAKKEDGDWEEEDGTSKEEDEDLGEEDDASKKEDDTSKEDGNSKIEDVVPKEEDNTSKQEGGDSKEDDISKEEDDDSRGKEDTSKINDDDSKEVDVTSKEKYDTSKQEDGDSKEDDSSKEDDDLRDEKDTSKIEDAGSKEEENVTSKQEDDDSKEDETLKEEDHDSRDYNLKEEDDTVKEKYCSSVEQRDDSNKDSGDSKNTDNLNETQNNMKERRHILKEDDTDMKVYNNNLRKDFNNLEKEDENAKKLYGDYGDVFGSEEEIFDKEDNPKGKCDEAIYHRREHDTEEAGYSNQCSYYHVSGGSQDDYMEQSNSVTYSDIPTHIGPHFQSVQVPAPKATGSEIKTMCSGDRIFNNKHPVLNLSSSSSTSLNHSTTRTVNVSDIFLAREDVRTADIVSGGYSGSSLERSASSDVEELRSGDICPVKSVINESIRIQASTTGLQSSIYADIVSGGHFGSSLERSASSDVEEFRSGDICPVKSVIGESIRIQASTTGLQSSISNADTKTEDVTAREEDDDSREVSTSRKEGDDSEEDHVSKEDHIPKEEDDDFKDEEDTSKIEDEDSKEEDVTTVNVNNNNLRKDFNNSKNEDENSKKIYGDYGDVFDSEEEVHDEEDYPKGKCNEDYHDRGEHDTEEAGYSNQCSYYPVSGGIEDDYMEQSNSVASPGITTHNGPHIQSIQFPTAKATGSKIKTMCSGDRIFDNKHPVLNLISSSSSSLNHSTTRTVNVSDIFLAREDVRTADIVFGGYSGSSLERSASSDVEELRSGDICPVKSVVNESIRIQASTTGLQRSKSNADIKTEDVTAKEEDDDSREVSTSRKEDDDSEEDHISKQDHISKEEDDDSRDEEYASKIKDDDSGEDDTSKEEDDDSKEEDVTSKEKDDIPKEEDDDFKDEEDTSKIEDEDSKEEEEDVTNVKFNSNNLRKDSNNSKNEDENSKKIDGDHGEVFGSEVEVHDKEDNPNGKCNEDYYHRGEHDTEEAGYSNQCSYYHVNGGIEDDYMEQSNSVASPGIPTHNGPHSQSIQFPTAKATGSEIKTMCSGDQIFNKKHPVLNLISSSSTSLNHSTTRTVNVSDIFLAREDVRTADIVSGGYSGSSLERSASSDVEELRSGDICPVKSVINESIRIQASTTGLQRSKSNADIKTEDVTAREEDDDSREVSTSRKEDDDSEEDHISKQDHISKEEDDDSRDEEYASKIKDDDSGEDDTSKEEDDDSKEEDVTSKEKDDIPKEEDDDFKDEEDTSKIEDEDSKEEEEDVTNVKFNSNNLRKDFNNSKNEDENSKKIDGDHGEVFGSEVEVHDKEDNPNGKCNEDYYHRREHDTEEAGYSNQCSYYHVNGGIEDDYMEQSNSVASPGIPTHIGPHIQSIQFPTAKATGSEIKTMCSGDQIFNKKHPVLNLISSSSTSLNHSTTRTVNVSDIFLAREDVRTADIVSGGYSGSSLERSASSDVEELRSGDICPVKSVIGESIRIQASTTGLQSSISNADIKTDNPSSSNSFRGRKSFVRANKFLFLVCLVASFSASYSSSPNVNSLQTATADIIIEIPAYYFSNVHVFFNQLHMNPVLVTGDHPKFKVQVFDVESLAVSDTDSCKDKDLGSCDTGTCDPVSGDCVCARGQIYVAAFQKCMPDCTRDCPPGFFMAKPCTEFEPGICKQCKPACAAGKFESIACGGAFDRQCQDLTALPAVVIHGNIISENRLKTVPSHIRNPVMDNIDDTKEVFADRGTGIKIVIKTLRANFDVVVGEVDHKEYDRDPSSGDFCSRHVPEYYLAKRSVAERMFYFRKEGKSKCKNTNPQLLKGSVHCLGPDHDLIRQFDSSKSNDASNMKFVEKPGTCSNSLQLCLDCRKDCAVRIDKEKCWHNEGQCYSQCESKNCVCRNTRCPCFRYEMSNCYEKRTECVGRKVNVVTLEPIFNKDFSYCHVKLLRLASYELRADIFVKNNLIASKKTTLGSEKDDFGFLEAKAPDLHNIRNRKYLLLRRDTRSNRIDLGYYKSDAKPLTGVKSDSMAFRPTSPFALNGMMWAKSKCSDIKMNLYTAFDRFPLTVDTPPLFHKLTDLPITKLAKDNTRYTKGQAFVFRKSESRRYVDLYVLKNKSVLRHFFPTSTILNDDSLVCRLINKTSYFTIAVKGKLGYCPGFLSAKLFDQDHRDVILHHYDLVVKGPLCSYDMQFNIPFKNDAHRLDKAFVLHLTSGQQTVEIVVVRDKKVTRILNTIQIPKIHHSKLANILTPIATVAAGFVILLFVLLIVGFFTRSKDDQNQGGRDNELHFRHVFFITWYVGARLSKSLLFTIIFLTYLFTVIHSDNYYTLNTFKGFQKREHVIFKGIFEDMEKHRVTEIHRQEEALIEEKNLCDIKLQKLDDYLAEHRQKQTLKRRLEMRAKAIKNTALDRVEKNLASAEKMYDWRKQDFNNKMESRLQQMRGQVEVIERKVAGHQFATGALGLFRVYRFFGGSKSFSRYIGLDVHFGGINYRHHLGSFKQGIQDLRRKVAELKTRKNNEKVSEQIEKSAKTKTKLRPPKIPKIHYPKPKIKVEFDNEQAKKVFALSWISKLVKDKILSAAAMAIMLAVDVLFFIYRHTRTYTMAVMMIYGFKKYCDLDELETERLKREEERQKFINTHAEFDDESSSDTDVICDRRQMAINENSSKSETEQGTRSGSYSSDTQTKPSSSSSSSSDTKTSRSSSYSTDTQAGLSRSGSSTSDNGTEMSRPGSSSLDTPTKRSRSGSISSDTGTKTSRSESLSSDTLKKTSVNFREQGYEQRKLSGTESDFRSAASSSDITTLERNSRSQGLSDNTTSYDSVANTKQSGTETESTPKPSKSTICLKEPSSCQFEINVINKNSICSKDDSRKLSSESSSSFETACEETTSENDRPNKGFHGDSSTEGTTDIGETDGWDKSRGVRFENEDNENPSETTSSESTAVGESSSVIGESSDESEERKMRQYNGHVYEEIDQEGYLVPHQRKKSISLAKKTNNIAMNAVGTLGSILLIFITGMKKLNIVKIILLNTHWIPMFILVCFVLVAVYCVIITAKYVLHTPILDEVGFFDLKISHIVTYRKVVNTRTSAHAFMINHVHIPYYEARINARINMYQLKAKLYKKLQCVRTVLHNSEYCSWSPGRCDGIKTHDDGFYKSLSQFKCHMKPAIPRRYSKFNRIQFKMEMMRSYDPYIRALRGIILDTFDVILAIIGIQILISITANAVFKMALSFDLIRQIKVYKTKRPIEAWTQKT